MKSSLTERTLTRTTKNARALRDLSTLACPLQRAVRFAVRSGFLLLALAAPACNALSPAAAPTTEATAAPAAPPIPSDTPAQLSTATLPPGQTAGYLTFVVNVHDWTHPTESADILLQLIGLFEKYGVRGDFYFTAEITRQLAETRPDVIEHFKNSNMTLSYHVRPPHPLYTGFDDRLKGLDDATLYQTLLDYETYALDLTTGDLDRSRPGGYTYVAQVFGRKPAVAPTPSGDPRLKDAAQRVYAGLGAQMTLLYHEEGTKVDQPFEYVNGLLVRPSDFSVTSIDGSDNFWWNFMSKPDAAQYNPTVMLQTQLAEWESHAYGRPPFVTALIHENNFYRGGPEGWTSIYYTVENGKRGDPLSPPFDLSAPDPSRPRTEADKAAIRAAYEELVAYAAAHLSVVTSEDIVALAPAEP